MENFKKEITQKYIVNTSIASGYKRFDTEYFKTQTLGKKEWYLEMCLLHSWILHHKTHFYVTVDFGYGCQWIPSVYQACSDGRWGAGLPLGEKRFHSYEDAFYYGIVNCLVHIKKEIDRQSILNTKKQII